MVKSKTAFSLAEALVSMVIIMIITCCSLPVLTKLKSGAGLNPNKIKGTFACYYNNGILYQSTCRERVCEPEQEVTTDGCEFGGILRAAKFYIYYIGGGGKGSSGQIGMKDFGYLHPEEVITLKPGMAGQPTTIYHNGKEFTALGGYNKQLTALTAKDISDNIESCQIITANGQCPAGSCANPSGSRKIKSCSVNAENESLTLNGCECYENNYGSAEAPDYDGHYMEAEEIKLANLKINGAKSRVNNYLANQGGNSNKYCDINNNERCFNFTLKDSSLDGAATTSHLAEILGNMNNLRQNKLISNIINLKPGAAGTSGTAGKPGAVVILW